MPVLPFAESYYCDHVGFELVGNYCYYLDDDNDPIYGKIQWALTMFKYFWLHLFLFKKNKFEFKIKFEFEYRSTFLDQQIACIHIGAHLPCWKDRIVLFL